MSCALKIISSLDNVTLRKRLSILLSSPVRKHNGSSAVGSRQAFVAERQVSFRANYPIITRQRSQRTENLDRGDGGIEKRGRYCQSSTSYPRPPISVSVIPAV